MVRLFLEWRRDETDIQSAHMFLRLRFFGDIHHKFRSPAFVLGLELRMEIFLIGGVSGGNES